MRNKPNYLTNHKLGTVTIMKKDFKEIEKLAEITEAFIKLMRKSDFIIAVKDIENEHVVFHNVEEVVEWAEQGEFETCAESNKELINKVDHAVVVKKEFKEFQEFKLKMLAEIGEEARQNFHYGKFQLAEDGVGVLVYLDTTLLY